MVKFITISYKVLHKERERLFYILIASIIFTISLYGFLIQKAIMNVVAREDIAKEIALTGAKVGDLEGKYLSLKNSITIDLAYEKGLKDAVAPYYISKKSITAMASKNEL